jgi:hypothetical protein
MTPTDAQIEAAARALATHMDFGNINPGSSRLAEEIAEFYDIAKAALTAAAEREPIVPVPTELQRSIEIHEAVAAETERCARVAESFGGLSDNLYANKMVEDIATAIRARGNHEGEHYEP